MDRKEGSLGTIIRGGFLGAGLTGDEDELFLGGGGMAREGTGLLLQWDGMGWDGDGKRGSEENVKKEVCL